LVRIIAFVSQQVAHAPGTLEKRGRGFDVAHVAGGERVDFHGPATPRAADRVRRGAPGWFLGKCGSIAAHASSDNQNSAIP